MGGASHIRIVLVGQGDEFSLAAEMARGLGAHVQLVSKREEAITTLLKAGADLLIADLDCDVPGIIHALRSQLIVIPVLACGIQARPEAAAAAIRAGAQDFLPLPPQHDLIAAAIVSVSKRASEFVGNDPELLQSMEVGLTFAHSHLPIFIGGEPGTGKEIMARMIHNASRRRGPFLTVECAGVAANVIDSELFGHSKGDFPEANADRSGRLAEAAEGTIFIRNIDALAPMVQARLASTLQAGLLPARGGSPAALITARVIASSTVDLESLVTTGDFRSDLASRFTMVKLSLPPLSRRVSDIAPLARYFADQVASQNGLIHKRLLNEALASLERYSWPGNVRELQEVVHRAVLISPDESIRAQDLLRSDGSRIAGDADPSESQPRVDKLVGCTMADVERELILKTLQKCGGNRTSASVILGISVRTMRNKLRSFIDAGVPVAPAA